MKWYYFFTDDYEFWHKHIQYSLGSDFTLVPIEIDNSKLILNEKRVNHWHHFAGCPLKLDLVINCIQTNLGSTIIFSDCTLFFCKNRIPQLAKYVANLEGKYDLVFADNQINSKVNIGLMLISCNHRTLKFWKKIRANFTGDSWDQEVVNNALSDQGLLACLTFSKVTWSTFHRSFIVCGHEFNENYRNSFFAYKQFIHPSTPTKNWNNRFKALNIAGFINDKELELLLRQESEEKI